MSPARRCAALVVAWLILTGCSPASTDTGTSMSMAPGETMPGMTTGSAAPTGPAAGPSATALMICKGDVPQDITKVLALTTPATPTAKFTDSLYTCTYQLPMGVIILSVKDSADKAAAAAYYTQLRPTLGDTQDAPGLGEKAYATTEGNVIVLKDNMTLSVDTTDLPTVFGTQKQKRTDLAYEIATIILGCWIEHS